MFIESAKEVVWAVLANVFFATKPGATGGATSIFLRLLPLALFTDYDDDDDDDDDDDEEDEGNPPTTMALLPTTATDLTNLTD